jgi:hypothetical protein
MYLPTTARVADAWGDADAARIKACSEAATARLRALTERLDRDVDETVDELVRRATTCSEALEGPGSFRFDYQRFGGYIAGIDRFRRRLLQLLDGIEHGAKQGPRLGMLP